MTSKISRHCAQMGPRTVWSVPPPSERSHVAQSSFVIRFFVSQALDVFIKTDRCSNKKMLRQEARCHVYTIDYQSRRRPRQQPVNVGLAGILRLKPLPHCGVDRQLGRALVQAGRH